MSKKCIPCGTPPTPYYKGDKNSVTQNHASVYRDTAFSAGVLIPIEFVIPAIGEDVQVCSKELVNVVIGSYFWNPGYGYLKIVNFDSCTGKFGLLNDDIQGAAIPGTVVSENSLWAVTARPCCADQDNFSLFPFLAADYVIPGVGNPVTLQVTSTFGLIQGTTVRIGSNLYFLDEINSSLEIVVINQGAGGTPGDTVEAKDVNGDYQYLITQAVSSACSSPGSDTVRLVGCDGVNQVILEGEYVGQVPVLQDPSSEEVQFKLLDTEVRICTFLTAVLDVLSATPSYTIEVDDESIFNIGEILQIDFGALRWEITDNTTPGELDITCTTGNPGSNFSVGIGANVCLQLSTDSLQDEINEIQSQVDDGWVPIADSGSYISASSFSVPGNVTSRVKAGQKLKLILNGSEFYANVLSASFGAGITTIAIIVNLDYILSAGTLDFVEVSYSNPADFPKYFGYDCNPGGFSAISTEEAVYWVIESTMFGRAFIQGTSDQTYFTIDIPAPSALAADFGLAAIAGQGYKLRDNGGTETDVGNVTYSAYPAVNVYKNQANATWTAAGGKDALIVYNYPIA